MKKRHFISGIFTGFLLYFSHHIWLGHHGSYVFNFYLFSIITITAYLASLKITSYLANFKTIKNQSRIDIIFLTIFFIVLFIPMSNINKSEISETENRTLAKWQPILAEEGKLNLTFGKDFESWFNDRFTFRQEIINVHNILFFSSNLIIHSSNNSLYNTKSHWMFAKNHIKYKLNEYPLEEIISNLDRFNDFCNRHGIKLYVLITPMSADIYAKYATPDINFKQKQINYNIVKEVQQKTKANIIFPFDNLKKASEKDYVYYKTDHHWTDFGAYTGYQDLINEIKRDFPEIKPISLSDYNKSTSRLVRSDWGRDYHEGETFKYLFPFLEKDRKKILDADYTYFDRKDKDILTLDVKDIPYHKEKISHYPKGNNLRVIETGTSFNESLLGFTFYTFKDLKYIRLRNVIDRKDEFKIMKDYKKEILDFRPDILILCITMEDLFGINDIFKED